MDIKPLYTVIPNNEGLQALKYFLDRREILDPPTHTLLHTAELVLTLNSQWVVSWDLCLFVCWPRCWGANAEPIHRRKTRPVQKYMDDVAGAASCTEQELRQFLTFASNFHLKLEYTSMVYLRCQTPVLGYLHNTSLRPLYLNINQVLERNRQPLLPELQLVAPI